MEDQVFCDGIGSISVIGGTVRLDLVTYSPTEKDARGAPAPVFRQRVVMPVEAFLPSADKIQEAVLALSKHGLAPRSPNEPAPAEAESARHTNGAAAAPHEAAAEPPPAPAKPPFP